MSRLAPVLTCSDLPEAELRAALLDGELFALGSGYCPVDEIAGRVHRALTLTASMPPKLIAERRTAAWILGAQESPPSPLELCAAISERSNPTYLRDTVVREVVIEEGELMTIGGLRLTTPLRTALDLARFEQAFGEPERRLLAALAVIGGFTLATCVAAVAVRRNLPAGQRALARLASSLPDQPALTRYTS